MALHNTSHKGVNTTGSDKHVMWCTQGQVQSLTKKIKECFPFGLKKITYMKCKKMANVQRRIYKRSLPVHASLLESKFLGNTSDMTINPVTNWIYKPLVPLCVTSGVLYPLCPILITPPILTTWGVYPLEFPYTTTTQTVNANVICILKCQVLSMLWYEQVADLYLWAWSCAFPVRNIAQMSTYSNLH